MDKFTSTQIEGLTPAEQNYEAFVADVHPKFNFERQPTCKFEDWDDTQIPVVCHCMKIPACHCFYTKNVKQCPDYKPLINLKTQVLDCSYEV